MDFHNIRITDTPHDVVRRVKPYESPRDMRGVLRKVVFGHSPGSPSELLNNIYAIIDLWIMSNILTDYAIICLIVCEI